MSEVRRALVIGCGRIGGGFNSGPADAMVLTHALAYVRHPKYELAACVDPDQAARERFMQKWGVSGGYPSLDEALSAGHYAIASLCVPTAQHAATLRRLANSDVEAIFAEKPLGGDVKEIREIAALFSRRGVPVAVNFTRRFDPSMHRLRDRIAKGDFGGLTTGVGWYVRGIVNNGTHLIDLASFLTGRTPRAVRAADAVRYEIEGDPTISGVLDLEGVSMFALPGSGSRFELELAFERALVAIEENGLSVRVRSFDASPFFEGARIPGQGERSATEYGVAMLRALDELDGWRRGRQLSSDMESAAAAIEAAGELRRMALEIRR